MRDIVTHVGTFFAGLTALPVIKTTQTSQNIDLRGYDGCMIYFLANTWTDGTITPAINVAPDNGSGAPGSFTAAPNADLVTWKATSATNYAPVKVGGAQPAAISSAATALNQRVGYIGGVAGTSDWLQVVSTISGSPGTGCGYDVIILLGRPRLVPAAV